MLLLWAEREMIIKQIGKRKWRRIGISFGALAVDEAKTRGMDIPAYVSPETPGVLTQLTNPAADFEIPLPLFISDDFLTYADRSRQPGNKCTLWLTMVLYDGIVQNFTHFTIPRRKTKKLRGELICEIFGTRVAGRNDDKDDQGKSEDFLD